MAGAALEDLPVPEATETDERGPTVLVADDDRSVRRLVDLALRLNGFEVVCAEDGRTALTLAVEHEPAAAVLDVGMPFVDGLEVCRRLRMGAVSRRPAILVLSGFSEPEARLRAFASGADDYIVKPVQLVELVERVRSRILESAQGTTTEALRALLEVGDFEREVGRRMDAGEGVGLLYVEVSQLRAFNQRYGFARGDRLLEWLARLLCGLALRHPGSAPARLGPYDFCVATERSSTEAFGRDLVAAFDEAIASFYDADDAERGWIEVTDRRGAVHRRRMLALTMGIATNERRLLSHPRQLLETAAEMASFARRRTDGPVVADRRQR